MREPAHDDAVAAEYLLPVDAQVLPRFARPARHREPPRDERTGIARPAGLHWKARKVDVLSLPDDLLARRARAQARRHVEHLLEKRELVPEVAQALRRLGLLQM